MFNLFKDTKGGNKDDKELDVIGRISRIKPGNMTVASAGKYTPYDAISVEFDPETREAKQTVFEVKHRSKDKCKYIRRDGSLIVDAKKVDELAKESKKRDGKAILAQYLEDENELTLFNVADRGKVNPKLGQKQSRKANKNTKWGGGKVDKEMYEYSLEDCYRVKYND